MWKIDLRETGGAVFTVNLQRISDFNAKFSMDKIVGVCRASLDSMGEAPDWSVILNRSEILSRFEHEFGMKRSCNPYVVPFVVCRVL